MPEQDLAAIVQDLTILVENLRKESLENRRAISRLGKASAETKKVAMGAILLVSIVFFTGDSVDKLGEENLGRLIEIAGVALGIGFTAASSGSFKNEVNEPEQDQE